MFYPTSAIPVLGAVSIPALQLDKKGQCQPVQLPVIEEHELTIHLPGGQTHHFLCLPQNLRELIVGYLISEGLITDLSELLKYSFNEDCTSAEICLNSSRGPNAELTQLPLSNLDLPSIFTAVKNLHQGFDIYKVTGSTHSCQLWSKGKLVRVFEDLGRHNAVDKAIGYACLQGFEPRECFLFTSCRIPTDLVKKVIRSGFPILASKSMPTKQSIELAQKYGLTLICWATPDSIVLYQKQINNPAK